MTEKPDRWIHIVGALEAEAFVVRFESPAGVADADPDAGAYLDANIAIIDLRMADALVAAAVGQLRALSSMPILTLVPDPAPLALVLSAYALGVDQCVPSTTGPRELVARIRALLRRTPPNHVGNGGTSAAGAAGLSVDVSAGIATIIGRRVTLTPREAQILYALLRGPGRVVSREELENVLPPAKSSSALDSNIRRLRHKLEAAGSRRSIVAVRGVGFRFDHRVPTP